MTTTTRRRPLAAAAIALTLLLAAGCSTPTESSGSRPEAAVSPTTEAPSADASPSAGTSPGTTTEAPDGTGDADDAPSDGPTQRPAPSASPSTGPEDDAEDGAEDSGDDAEKDDEAAEDSKPTKDKAEKKEDQGPQWPSYGSSGEQVVALQQRLVDLGYYLPQVDGQFGPMTQQAVWALQKAAGLGRDAVVGPRTQQALDDGVRPRAQSSSGKVVEIDLGRQLLLTVEDGRVTRIVNASSGNGETYEAKDRTYTANTPRGSFAVYMERDYLHESTLELGSMYRPKYFTGSFAVHGSGSIPPYPASHGCVRVSNSAMNWLWDSWGMPKGTPVVVY